MANGMRKLLKYMKEHPPKNVELQRINVLEAENARWLDEELGKCATYKYETLQYAQTGVWAVFVDGDVKATSDNKLSALWQAYKKVKGIKE